MKQNDTKQGDKWACQVKIIITILTHTAYFKGIRTTTQFHVLQLTWYSSYWNESMSKESGEEKKKKTWWTPVGKTEFTSMFNINYCNSVKTSSDNNAFFFFLNVWNTQLSSCPDIWLSCVITSYCFCKHRSSTYQLKLTPSSHWKSSDQPKS